MTTMSNPVNATDSFVTAFEGARDDWSPPWLQSLRESAFSAFRETGFPTQRRGNEAWKYTDIRALAAIPFAPPEAAGPVTADQLSTLLPPDDGFARITFVDGHFAPQLSHGLDVPGVKIAPLSTALADDGRALEPIFAPSPDRIENAFALANTALFADGALVEVTAEVDTPVHVVHVVSDAVRPTATFPRTLVIARPQSRVTLIETYVGTGDAQSLTAPATDVVLEDGARVDHYRLMLDSTSAFHVGRLSAVVGRDATYECLVYETGSHLGRLDSTTLFDDTGSSANLRGLYITSGEQHIDNLVTIDHAKPHNTSRLYYKGILDGKSSAVFGGTVFVRKGADKTDSHQEDKNLLLSDEAVVNSKPALEIYADDVKAGHGATAGAIADEALFYMQSRGIDSATAMRLLIAGFASEIIDAVTVEPLRAWLEAHALAALPGLG